MRKTVFASAAAAMLAIAVLGGCAAQSGPAAPDAQAGTEKVRVVASFYPMYDFAQKIGGDRVDVVNLVPTGTEPHDWEPSTADLKTLSQAQVLVYSGAGMEHWIEDVTSTLGNDQLTIVEASEGAELIPAAEDEHGHEGEASHEEEADHDHGAFDPHVWLSPENARVELANIRDGLIKADPEGASVYEANYAKYAAELEKLDKEYAERLSGLANREIVVSHQAFGYLCERYGLEQHAIEGLEADSEPDAKTMSEIVDFVKGHQVKVIFSEELVSDKVAKAIASETGASTEVLNPLEGLSDEDLAAGADYFSVMRDNLDKLVRALS